jgi:hypothetical protein
MDKHQDKFEVEMNKLAEKNIVGFYLKFIAPLQPKEMNIAGKDGGAINVNINDAKNKLLDKINSIVESGAAQGINSEPDK